MRPKAPASPRSMHRSSTPSRSPGKRSERHIKIATVVVGALGGEYGSVSGKLGAAVGAYLGALSGNRGADGGFPRALGGFRRATGGDLGVAVGGVFGGHGRLLR